MRKMKLSDEAKPVPPLQVEEPINVTDSRQKGTVLKRKLSQKNSGIHEPDNTENIHDHFTLSVLDPTDNSIWVWFVRAFLFWGVFFVCGFYITFGADASYWAVGLGAVAAYVLCIGAYFFEAYVFVPWWYESNVGKPMVHWMSWAVFLDIIYHVVNPRNLKDCRVEEYAKQVIPILKEECSPEDEKQEFWLDFCADVGDGFNPTFAVFSTMARSVLRFEGGLEIPRADSVVIGGDIVYPWPRHEDLLARFLRPLSWAYPEDMADRKRRMYVMPGNHEWADGLRNYRRVVLDRATGQIGGWTIGNRTSYFCVKLPFNWWMFCVDPGNEMCQDLDQAQVEYFTRIVREQTGPEDRFILAVHEPDWIKNSLHGFALFKNLALLRKNVLGDRLRLSLAGDLHYYRRMEESDGDVPTLSVPDAPYPHFITSRRQLVVAGNGGAFSHPTYVPSSRNGIKLGEPHFVNGPHYSDVMNFPTPQQSRKTYNSKWFEGFSYGKNYGFGSILGMVYIGMCLAVSPIDYTVDGYSFPTGVNALANANYMLRMLKSFWFYPSLMFLVAVLFIIATTSAALRTKKAWCIAVSMALFHIALHVVFVLGMKKLVDAAWAQAIWSEHLLVRFDNTVLFCFLSNVSMYAIGYFLAPFLTAVYLYISQNIVGNAYNEPMSTIECQDDKGFCRMRFTADGDIDYFHIGIKKVPRKWEEVKDAARTNELPSHFQGKDIKVIEPFIVERVLIKRGEYSPPTLDKDEVDVVKTPMSASTFASSSSAAETSPMMVMPSPVTDSPATPLLPSLV